MEIVESLAYIALGFIPTLALLEVGYRIPPTKSLLPIAFRT
jgi:hypothetical protein